MFGSPDSNPDFGVEMGWQGFMCIGTSLHDEEDFEGAAGAFSEAVEICPYVASGYLFRGMCFAALENYEKAIQDFTDAVRLDPFDQEAFIQRAICYFLVEEYSRVAGDIEKIFELGPGSSVTYYMRGCLFMLEDRLDQAVRDFESALTLDPEDYDSRMNRLMVYEEGKKWGIYFPDGSCAGHIIYSGEGRADARVIFSSNRRLANLINGLTNMGQIQDKSPGNVVVDGVDLEDLVDIIISNGFILATEDQNG